MLSTSSSSVPHTRSDAESPSCLLGLASWQEGRQHAPKPLQWPLPPPNQSSWSAGFFQHVIDNERKPVLGVSLLMRCICKVLLT